MKNELEFTEEQLDYIALCIVQAVHCYSSHGYDMAMQQLLADSWFAQAKYEFNSTPFRLLRRMERVGKANGYWEV